MQECKMAVTIKKIAELAGVAPTTVSLVLRNSKKVGSETKKHVMSIIEEMDYYPNQSGKFLKQGRTDAIAVLSSFIQNIFKLEFVNGVEEAIYKTPYQLRHYYAQSGMEIAKCKEILFAKMADAVIALNILPDTAFLEKMRKSSHPVVLVEDVTPGFAGVTFNNYQAAYDAVEYFVKHGRRRIAISLGTTVYKGHAFVDERLRGYLAALKDFDIPNPEIIEISDYSLNSGRSLLSHMKERGSLPDALFCASGDLTAAGFLQQALAQGLKIPDDLAVMGFDDSIIAQSCTLGLTTIQQPVQAMGSAAFELALALIEGIDPEASSRIVRFEPKIIVRQSA